MEILNSCMDCDEIQFKEDGSWAPMRSKKEVQEVSSASYNNGLDGETGQGGRNRRAFCEIKAEEAGSKEMQSSRYGERGENVQSHLLLCLCIVRFDLVTPQSWSCGECCQSP